MDLEEVHDAEGKPFIFLNVLDIATRFSAFILVPHKSSAKVVSRFLKRWVSFAGVPVQIVHDQGGEFFGEFARKLQQLGIQVIVTPTEAPWQNSIVERHGAVLGEILEAMVEQMQIVGEAEMELGGILAASAKNRRPDHTGHSSRTRCFGVEERLPGSILDAVLEGENPVEIGEMSNDPVFARTVALRTAAQEALVRLEA